MTTWLVKGNWPSFFHERDTIPACVMECDTIPMAPADMRIVACIAAIANRVVPDKTDTGRNSAIFADGNAKFRFRGQKRGEDCDHSIVFTGGTADLPWDGISADGIFPLTRRFIEGTSKLMFPLSKLRAAKRNETAKLVPLFLKALEAGASAMEAAGAAVAAHRLMEGIPTDVVSAEQLLDEAVSIAQDFCRLGVVTPQFVLSRVAAGPNLGLAMDGSDQGHLETAAAIARITEISGLLNAFLTTFCDHGDLVKLKLQPATAHDKLEFIERIEEAKPLLDAHLSSLEAAPPRPFPEFAAEILAARGLTLL